MFMYVLVIITGIMTMSGNLKESKIITIEGFRTLQSCQKAEFKAKDQDGVFNAFCIEKDM